MTPFDRLIMADDKKGGVAEAQDPQGQQQGSSERAHEDRELQIHADLVDQIVKKVTSRWSRTWRRSSWILSGDTPPRRDHRHKTEKA
jgi:hypothetical protein